MFYLKVTSVYLIAYLYCRLWLWRLLSPIPEKRTKRLIMFDIISLLVPLFILSRHTGIVPLALMTPFTFISFTWAAILFFCFPFAVIFEPIRIFVRHFAKDFCNKLGLIPLNIVVLIVLIMTAGGLINARYPEVVNLTMEIEVPESCNINKKEIHAVAASDIHAGKLMNADRVAKVINIINSLQPDIILLIGDILDDKTVEESGTINVLKRLQAPLDTYAVLGNHEYYNGKDWSEAVFRQADIKLLKDEIVNIENCFLLVGREDVAAEYMNSGRKTLDEIIADHNKKVEAANSDLNTSALPTILLDHSPYNLNEAQDAGIDYQLSGHTHNGQIFPYNFVTKMVFEKSHGYYRKGDTEYYISSGAGFWGPPMRTSSRPEVLSITVRFKTIQNSQ